jgi:ATP-binding cassette subfamily B protein
MNKPEMLSRFLKGSRLTYLGAMSAVLGNVFVSAITPMLIKSTLDNILGNEPVATRFGAWLINGAGGVERIRANLWIILLVLIGMTLVQGVFQFLRAKLAALTGENSAKRMRDRIFLHVLRQPFDYHVKSQTGDIIQRCTSDIETVQRFVANQSIEAGSIILQVTVVLIIMLSLDIRYTLTSVFLVPVILIMTIRFFKSMMTIFLETDESEGVLSSTLQENLTGVRVVKAFAAQQFEINKFDEANRTFRDNVMKIIKLMSNFWGATDLLSMLQFFFVVLAGTVWIARGQLTLGTMVAFITYAGMLIWPIRNLGHMVGFMGQAFVSLTRVQEILDSKQEDYDTGLADLPIKGGIQFEDVQFGYTVDRPLLQNLSFEVAPGTTTAILGATGSGKSSLVHLLLRLYDYQSGSIKIDGTELSSISRAWIRKNVGIVLQEPFLFSRTIEDNIRIGQPGSEIEDTRVAARIACVDEAIAEFEEGYATMVGERGVTLSGGQRQRVAIARTILREVPILIFDDSLSAVDTETDAAIRKALRDRRRQTTTLIISHRITTLAEADQILVLDGGRIVQRGTHHELIEQDGHYKQIWELQSRLEDIA